MGKKKTFIVAGLITVCALAFFFLVRNKETAEVDAPQDMIERLENALGDEYEKQSMTELIATLQYGDAEGNTINYHILKTTYYEADPAEVAGLNTDAFRILFNPETAENCREMKIQDRDAALYEHGALSYLCWTYSPEVSYILEYNSDVVADEEIIKMAESARLDDGEEKKGTP